MQASGELGFIGLGKIGLPMARRLIEAGYRLRVCDLNPQAVQQAVALGAIAHDTPAEIASMTDIVLVSLPTPEVVAEVAGGALGVIKGKSIKYFIDLSTTGPRVAKSAAKTLEPIGVTWIDAPVSGGVAGAVAGTLAVMVACPRVLFEPVSLILRHLGRPFHVGEEPGMGQVMKLANNMLSATALAATSEVMVMGVKAGLDPIVMTEVLNAGSGRNNATEIKFPKGIIPRSFNLGFSSGLMLKDVNLGVSEGTAMGVPMAVTGAVLEAWRQVVEKIGAEQDSTTFIKLLEQVTGVTVQARK
ncbi:MAG TPA: NAD(P)-dependent oxidoreductase [Burkholderiales bacterium]|jgi:3-hydroxyisobutyrate dehydrogenase-like beta-hydroxyacid dehydrogenase|nr:NAD(P)-dependent oxidoreductase [Burkholderiales bacterium]